MANDGKFILDGKRVKFSDYGGSSKTALSRLNTIEAVDKIEENVIVFNQRLWAIESEIKHMKESIEDLDNSYHDIEIRIEKLEEKIDGID